MNSTGMIGHAAEGDAPSPAQPSLAIRSGNDVGADFKRNNAPIPDATRGQQGAPERLIIACSGPQVNSGRRFADEHVGALTRSRRACMICFFVGWAAGGDERRRRRLL